MKPSALTPSALQNEFVPELVKLHQKVGKPVSLNELPNWVKLTKSEKIKIGRAFKKMVMAGEIDGIKFVGIRKDNHSTYSPIGVGGGGGILRFFRQIFRG